MTFFDSLDPFSTDSDDETDAMLTFYYRCDKCKLNMTSDPVHMNCIECGKPARKVTGIGGGPSDLMSVAETEHRRKQLKFERYIENETPEQRANRIAKELADQEDAKRAATKRDETFSAIIAMSWSKDEIIALELLFSN